MDMSLSEAYMCECKNGHTFCDTHKLKVLDKVIKKGIDSDEDEDNDEDERYEVDPIYCPICQFKALYTEDALKYLLKKLQVTEKELLNELKGTFSNYEELQNHVKGTK